MAKEMGGRQVPGSGAISGIDGDVVAGEDFIECKTTAARQITLKLHDWEKTVIEAARSGRIASMRLQFNNVQSIIPVYDLVVLDKEHYMELRRRAGEVE